MNKDPFQNTMFDDQWKTTGDARNASPLRDKEVRCLPTYGELVEEVKHTNERVLELDQRLQTVMELLYGH